MSHSGGSERMKRFWAGYVKPSAAEAARRLATRKLNAERLPWVVKFDHERRCEARDWTPKRRCKNKAYWAFVEQDRFTGGTLIIACWTHLVYGHLSMDMVDVTNEWYVKNGWQDLEGVVHPYRRGIDG